MAEVYDKEKYMIVSVLINAGWNKEKWNEEMEFWNKELVFAIFFHLQCFFNVKQRQQI